MTDGSGRDDDAGLDLRKLAQDWVTLWQSELAALAADRETQEAWQAMLGLWAGAASAMLRALPRDAAGQGWYAPPHPHSAPSPQSSPARGEGDPSRDRPAATAGAAAAAAAPDPRDAAIERLARRVAELEARLAELERDGSGGGARGTGERRGTGASRRRPGRDAAPGRRPD